MAVEVSALRWADGADAADGNGMIFVTVRRSKTNPEGDTRDVRADQSSPARAVFPRLVRRGGHRGGTPGCPAVVLERPSLDPVGPLGRSTS